MSIVVILLTALSCCRSPVGIYHVEDMPSSDISYRESIDKWTRSRTAVRRFITILDVSATYRSWEVREAYLRELTERKGLTEFEQQTIRDREKREYYEYHEFVFSAYCSNEEWLDFKGFNPYWKITLSNSEGVEIFPAGLTEIEINAGEKWLFYPFISKWQRTYSVKFPRVDTTGGNRIISPEIDFFRLNFRSLLGEVKLNWNVKG